MKATEILSSEHRLIEQVLSALETAAWLFSQEETFRPGFFVDAAEFIRGFADGIHHRKEEDIFFKALVKNGTPQEGHAVEALLHEHDLGREFTRRFLTAAKLVMAGDRTARAEVVYNARRYAALLRHHIEIEDKVIFPLADNLIPPDQHAVLLHNFEYADDGKEQAHYEKCLALANELEKELEM